MKDAGDIEELVHSISEMVMQRLETGESRATGRNFWFLLPLSSMQLRTIATLVEDLIRQGHRVRVLSEHRVFSDLEHNGWLQKLGPDLMDADRADISGLMTEFAPGDILVIGTLGFQLARSLSHLEDNHWWIRLTSQAMLRGLMVVAARDDLTAAPHVMENQTAAQAKQCLQGMEQVGIQLRLLSELNDFFAQLSKVGSTLSRAVGDLVTEKDVTTLAEAGQRRLLVGKKTVVTPLALSRALELGVEIARED